MKAPESFLKSLAVVSEEQKELLIHLYEHDQDHLFPETIFDHSTPPATRRAFASKLQQLNKSYQDGGLVGYITNAKRLLANSKAGVNPLAGWKPSVPTGQLFEMYSKDYLETEKIGLNKLGKVGFVLVAGGLGERLGYSGIKVRSTRRNGFLALIYLKQCLSISVIVCFFSNILMHTTSLFI